MKNSRTKIRNKRVTKRNVTRVLRQISEKKMLTGSCHHFPLNGISSLVYNDSSLAAGGWTAMNLIAQGTANNQRIGFEVSPLDIDLAITVYSADNTPDTVRVMVILDKATNGLAPLLGEIFDNTGNNLSVLAPAGMRTYKMLLDEYINIGDGMQVKTKHWQIKTGFRTRWTGANSILAHMELGAYYIMVVSCTGTNSSECLGCFYRFKYTDN